MATRPDFEVFVPGEAGGLVYRRRSAPGGGRRPLLVFLHGVGERGADNDAQLSYGFFADAKALFAPARLDAAGCDVLAPQAPVSDKWVDVARFDAPAVTLTPTPTAALAAVLTQVDALVASGRADPSRLYLAGLSMGAFGVFDMLARRPRQFAAAIAVCGAGDLTVAPRFASVPLHLAHGALDRGVPVEHSRAMVRALTAAGASPRYREYEDGGHVIWDRALAEPDLPGWLFGQRRRL